MKSVEHGALGLRRVGDRDQNALHRTEVGAGWVVKNGCWRLERVRLMVYILAGWLAKLLPWWHGRQNVWSVYGFGKKISRKNVESTSWLLLAAYHTVKGRSVQLFIRVWLFATPWTTSCQASLSISNSGSLLKLMSIESVMPSNHLILCRPLLLPPSIFPSIRVFSNESVICIRWPKYWSFSFNIGASNEHSGLISFRMDWLEGRSGWAKERTL